MTTHLILGRIVRRKFFFSVLAAGALVALAAPTASAARSASAGSECQGGTWLSPVSAQRLPAGVTAYTYDLPDGTTFENIAPPSGFNSATASSTLLSELNIPARPTGAAAMKTWEAQVAPFTKSGISRSEKFCAMDSTEPEPEAAIAGQSAVSAAPLSLVGHSGTTSFSGYELRSGSYHRVVGRFVQPATGTDLRSMSSWVGLNTYDGSKGRLIQDGAGNEASYGGSPFWEEYCGGGSSDGCNAPVIDFSASARPGNTVSMNVAYNGHTAYFQVAINGILDINATDKIIKSGVTGGVADFMTERTGGDNIPTSKQITWSALRTYASYSSSTFVPFGSQKYYADEMTTNGNYYSPSCKNTHVLMYPGDVSREGFVNYYCRST
jgi:hypothetical protein